MLGPMKTMIILLAATLAGCAAPAKLVGNDGDALILRVDGPNPIYSAGLIEGADLQCPGGWTKVGDSVTRHEGRYRIEWRVRCRIDN